MSPVTGHELTIPELANRLKQIIRMEKEYKWEVLEKPTGLVPQQKNIAFVGTVTRQVRELDKKATGGKEAIDKRAWVNRKEQEDQGSGTVHSTIWQHNAPDLKSLKGKTVILLQRGS